MTALMSDMYYFWLHARPCKEISNWEVIMPYDAGMSLRMTENLTSLILFLLRVFHR